MNKKRFLILTALMFCSLTVIVPVVSASTVTIWDNTPYSTVYKLWEIHPSSDGDPSAFGGAFTATNTGYLTAIEIYLKRLGTLDATLEVQVVVNGVSGTIPVDAVPSGDFVELSMNTRAANTIATSETLYGFYFTGTNLLTAGQNYTVSVQVIGTGSLVEMSKAIYVGACPNSGPSNAYAYYTNAYHYFSGNDMSFRVYGTNATSATPTPTPSPTPEAMPNWISDIIDAIIPIFTPLLVIFICGALGWRFAGAWGFFAGINLAIVLMYVVASQYMPLWAIVAVVIVDIALLFGKVGFDRR